MLVASLASAQEDDPASLLAEPDPVVEAIVAAPRDEPADFARAVFVLVDLGESGRAKPILEALVGQQLDEPTLASLVTEFGSAKFLKLAGQSGLGPQAAEFASRCMEAAATRARDPQRLAAIVARLGSDNRREQTAALVDLRTTGMAGVEYLLAELPAAEGQKQNQLRQALVAMAPTSTPLLLAALDADDLGLVAQAAIAMAEIGEDQAVPFLAIPAALAPTDSPVAKTSAWSYERLAGRPFSFDNFLPITDRGIAWYLDGAPAFSPDAAGNVPLGGWDADAKRIVTAAVPSDAAGVVLASRLAAAQAAAHGDRSDLVRRALVLGLESRAVRTRYGLPVEATNPAVDATPSQLAAALSEAIGKNRSAAAVALCEALAATGDVTVLSSVSGRPTALAKALDAAHPAVRFAALDAILQLNPPRPFPGSSRVAPTLAHFAASEGDTVAVVATPNNERSATLGGRLNGTGVRPLITNRGCEAVELAATGGDVSAVFVDMAILDPPVRETVFRLRRQIASAGVPIVLTAGDGRLAEAQTLAAEHTRVLAMPRPHTADDAAAIVDELAALLPADWPDAEARAAQAEQAREWIAKLQADGPAFYGLAKTPNP